MVAESTSRCENLSCLCDVPPQEATCSAYCASPDGRDVQNITCECGHATCKEAVESQLHGEGGRESVS